MRKHKLIFTGTLFFIFACSQQPAQKTSHSVGPKVLEAIGYIVPPESISDPKVIEIDTGKLLKIPLGKPEVVRTNSNVRRVGTPKVVIAGEPQVSTPGQDSFAMPIPLMAKGHRVAAGIPEVVNAKDAYSKDQNPKNFSCFSKQQGLKNAFIGTLLADSRHNLWISHAGGVTKYDGTRFTNYSKKEGLSVSTVVSMMEDKNGILWFGTYEGGVNTYDGHLFSQLTEADGLSNNTVLKMLQDKQGNIWIGTLKGVSMYNGSSFIQYTKNEGLLDNQVNDILEDRHGNIWIATEEGASKFDGTSFSHFTEKEGLSNKIVNCLLEDRSGNIWFGTYGGGMSKYNGQTFTHYTEEEGLLSNFIFCAFEDHIGNLWFGTDIGLIKYCGAPPSNIQLDSEFDTVGTSVETFENFTSREGMSNAIVTNILEDYLGNIWIGTYGGGINKYDGNLFTYFTQNEGLAGNEVSSILQDQDGRIWFGSDGGINLFDGKFMTTLPNTAGLSNTIIKAILKDHRGHYWIATNGNGVFKYIPNLLEQSGTIIHFREEQGLINDIVLSLCEDQYSNIWIGTISGVCKYDGKSFTYYTEKEGLSNNYTNCILEDRQGSIWFGTYGGGVTKFQPKTADRHGSFTHFNEKGGFSDNIVRCMMEDIDGNIWLGTETSGVTKYVQGRDGHPASFIHFSEKEGLCNNAVLSILEDSKRNLWFGTRMGLSILTSKKLASLSQKIKSGLTKESDIFFKNYTYENGFLGVGCTINAIYEDNGGIVWVGGNDRLTACHPLVTETTFDSIAPNIQLTGVSLYNESIEWSNLEQHQDSALKLGNGVTIKNFAFDSISRWYSVPHNLSLAYSNNYVAFNYVGITMNQPKKVKYQYILEGNDEQWSAVTLRTEAVYGNLAAGTYTFKVKAMNADGFWSDELTYPFSIRPPWWLTWWSYLLYAVLLLTLVYYAQRFQKIRIVRAEQEKSKQKQSILNERLRISRDLHDEVGATLSGISMYSHIAKEQIKAQSNIDLLSSLNIMQESSGDMVKKLNDIIWLLNPEQARLQQLVEKLEEYIRQLAEYKNVAVSVDIIDHISVIELQLEVRRNIYLIFKEAINNSFKYSQAGSISLTIRSAEPNLEFILQDDGVGFDLETVKRGNGLNNMHSRAKEIGATLRIESSPGHGSRLSLTYRVPS